MPILDPTSEELAQYDWRYGTPAPFPRHVVDAPKGDTWYYYYTQQPPLRTPGDFTYGAAPQYGSTYTNMYETKQPIQAQLGAQAAASPTQAPTAGAYTGIPASGCNSNGTSGSPY